MQSVRCALAGLLLGGLLQAACSSQPIVRSSEPMPAVVPSAEQSEEHRVLAGEWEYEDGAAVILKLDERGNGTYAWEDGRLLTTSLSDHTWTGLWSQKENDREGGFVVTLSPDFSEGEGRWWYTRIGANRAPTDKGGTFHLNRVTTSARSNDTPPAP